MAGIRCPKALSSDQAHSKVGPEVNSAIATHHADFNSFDLPADVFQDGEVRPIRTTKKKKAAQAASTANGSLSANNKRSFSNTGLNVSDRLVTKSRRHNAKE